LAVHTFCVNQSYRFGGEHAV